MSEFWDEHQKTIDPENFRGHHHYLDQLPEYPYERIVAYIRREGLGPYLSKLKEDGAFGCVTREVDGVTVSRDLLDSILEIAFLRRELGHALEDAQVLDIGAGYGRLAHRLCAAFPRIEVTCTDSVLFSSLLCAKYLAYRGVTRARVGAPEAPVDLAVNVHCWSECTLGEIGQWLRILNEVDAQHLFIVPHHTTLRAYSPEHGGGLGEKYDGLLRARGWQEMAEWFGPDEWPRAYYLFRRST